MFWNLRNRFLIPIIGILILGMAATSYISYTKAASNLEDTLIQSSVLVRDMLSRELGATVKDAVDDVMAQATRDVYIRTITTPTPENVRASTAALQYTTDTYQTYQTLGIIDPSGTVVASNRLEDAGKLNLGDRPYFRDAMQGKTSISDAIASRVNGKPVFVVAAPIRSGGKIIGAIYGAIDLAKFTDEVIAPVKIGKTGYAFLVAQSGFVAAHPDRSLILTLDLKGEAWAKPMFSSPQGLIEYNYKGKDRLLVFVNEQTTGWRIGVTVEMDEIAAAVAGIRDTHSSRAGSCFWSRAGSSSSSCAVS